MGAGGLNIYDTRLDWGPSAYSHTSVFSTDLIYQLPFGKGKQWGSHLNPVLEGALGGWQLSGVLYATSGDFLDVTSETSRSREEWPYLQPDRERMVRYLGVRRSVLLSRRYLGTRRSGWAGKL